MYAVIRTGGKQYRVAPGDVVKIESVPSENQTVEFSDVLAVSGEPGLAKPASAKVTAEVVARRPRGQDPGLPSQAQEAVQEDAGTPPELYRGAHQGDRGRWRHLHRLPSSADETSEGDSAMAHKKGGGSSTNGRDSNAQRLGVKAFGGEVGHRRHPSSCASAAPASSPASTWAAAPTTRSSPR